MQATKNPITRFLIHLVLLAWVLFSIVPFVMSIITSLQFTRDATARVPRWMPMAFVDHNVAIALGIGLGVLLLLWINHTSQSLPNRPQSWLVMVAIALVMGVGFYLVTLNVTDKQTFETTLQNYQTLWLDSPVSEFSPYGWGALGLIGSLVVIGVAAQRTPYKTPIYLGMVGIILGVIVWLPQWFELAEFYGFFLNSVIVTVGTLAISISIGCLAGYALARYSGVTGVVILFVALAFRALPRMAFILPYYFFAQISGLYDTYFLLIITFVAINQPFTIWMLRSFFMEIPRELEEAAMIDGCNRYTAFLRVILPIAWTGIITTSLFTLLLAYNEFLMARLLTSSLWTLPVGISRFTSGEDVRLLPLSNASAVSITIPIIFIVIFFQRYLIKGLVGGAVKG
jgi:multiple sugar transport system permease protein